jgi:hypothetical protein
MWFSLTLATATKNVSARKRMCLADCRFPREEEWVDHLVVSAGRLTIPVKQASFLALYGFTFGPPSMKDYSGSADALKELRLETSVHRRIPAPFGTTL